MEETVREKLKQHVYKYIENQICSLLIVLLLHAFTPDCYYCGLNIMVKSDNIN